MEGVYCLICGNESSSHYDTNAEYSSALVQNYLKIFNHYFQKEVKFEVEEGEMVTPCKSCILYLTSVVNGMERIEELNKNVAELEQHLWGKLKELKSNRDSVLSQLKVIKESMIERQNEGLNQNEIYLRKGTEKACSALAGPMSELEEKLDWFKKWADTNTGKIKTEVEGAFTVAEETCHVVSVTSMATSAEDKSFGRVGEVFQMKTEQEDDADIASAGDGEPVLEGVVKIEKEFVRKTRQGSVHRTKEVSLSFGTVDIVSTTENEKSAGEPMLIDLEEVETRSIDARNMSVSPPPQPLQDIHLEKSPERNEIDEAESFEELNMEVEEEDEIPDVSPDDDDDNASTLSSNKEQNRNTSNDEKTSEDETSSIANRPASTPPHPSSSSGSAAVAISEEESSQGRRNPRKKATCYHDRFGKFHCKKCKKSDESLSNILHHYESVHRVKNFKCDICNVAAYASSKSLVQHKMNCQQILENLKAKEMDPKFKFVCKVCGERFDKNQKIIAHQYFAHEYVRRKGRGKRKSKSHRN